MDKRHIYLMYEILRLGWNSTLEIGCYNGASSTAFIEALNNGYVKQATFCEVSVRPSLLSVLKNAKDPSKVRLSKSPSWQVLDVAEEFDFIFLDAAHDAESVAIETRKLLRRRPMCLMAHDTNSTAAGFSHCEGALALKEAFYAQDDYLCLEDAVERPDELTHRGLFLATTSVEVYASARALFG